MKGTTVTSEGAVLHVYTKSSSSHFGILVSSCWHDLTHVPITINPTTDEVKIPYHFSRVIEGEIKTASSRGLYQRLKCAFQHLQAELPWLPSKSLFYPKTTTTTLQDSLCGSAGPTTGPASPLERHQIGNQESTGLGMHVRRGVRSCYLWFRPITTT